MKIQPTFGNKIYQDTDTNYVHIGDNTDNMEVTTNNDEYVNVGEINENTTDTNE